MTDGQRLPTQALDRHLHREGWPDIAGLIVDLRQTVLYDELGQRLVQPAFRLPQHKQHGQQDITRPGHTVRKDTVCIQGQLRFLEHRADLFDLWRGRLRLGRLPVKIKQTRDVGITGVDLRLKEEDCVGNHLGLARGQHVGHFGVTVAWPRPATQIGNRHVVNRNYRHPVERRSARRLNAKIVGFALEASNQIAVARKKHYNGHEQPEKPVSLPESRLAHRQPPHAACIRLVILNRCRPTIPAFPKPLPAAKWEGETGACSAFLQSRMRFVKYCFDAAQASATRRKATRRPDRARGPASPAAPPIQYPELPCPATRTG